MSGHSKWSKVKHQKATTDAARGQAFTRVSRAITIAVREGGGIADPEKNYRLRLAMEKAREVNMPKETTERAIARAGGGGGEALEQVLYEGYGPSGVAFLLEVATDNRQRTVSLVKHLFDRAGGTLASRGAVSFMFTRAGVITVPKVGLTFDRLLEVAIAVGADDVIVRDDLFEIYTPATALSDVKQKLVEQGIPIDNTELIMKPTSTINLADGARDTVEKLVADLEALEDVQRVYTNTE